MHEVLGKVIYHLDEPFANPTSLVQYLLMSEARKYGIKVVLNGHGSDEALAGYSRFLPPFLAQLLLSGHPLLFLKNYRMFRQNMQFTNRRIFDHFMMGVGRQFGRTSALASVASTDPASDDARSVPYCQRAEALQGAKGLSLLGADLWEVFSTRTLPKWLRMEDRMSMACSIESRLPFLDYRLIEMTFNLPDGMKERDGFTKAVLREAMQSRLPVSITADRKKRRFSSPYGQWLRKEWRSLAEDNLLGACRLDGHMDTHDFKQRLKLFMVGDGKALEAETIWRALSTELFLGTFSQADDIPG
jgi:asparagine synthase (glutamine-hydrolysing)